MMKNQIPDVKPSEAVNQVLKFMLLFGLRETKLNDILNSSLCYDMSKE